jgi:hypothetical protein
LPSSAGIAEILDRDEPNTHGYTVVVRGLRHGKSFYRELEFPPATDMPNLLAHLADGVLTLSAPYGTGHGDPDYHVIEIRLGFWACHPDAAPL